MRIIIIILFAFFSLGSYAQVGPTVTTDPGPFTPFNKYRFLAINDSGSLRVQKQARFDDSTSFARPVYINNPPADGDSSARGVSSGWVKRNGGSGGSKTDTTNKFVNNVVFISDSVIGVLKGDASFSVKILGKPDIDSLRRLPGSLTVQGYKNGEWRDMYADSVGTGGSSGGVDTAYALNDSVVHFIKGSIVWDTKINGKADIDTTNKWVTSVVFPTDSTAIVCKGAACTTYSVKGGANGGGSGSSQTLPQVLATGRTFSATDSIILFGSLYLKGGILKTDTINSSISAPVYAGKKLWFFGTSITKGSTGIVDTAYRWSSLVSRQLGVTEMNYGDPGSLIQKGTPVNPNGGTNMIDRIPTIPTKASTDALLIYAYGENDVTNNGNGTYSLTNFSINYRKVIDSTLVRGWTASTMAIVSNGFSQSSVVTIAVQRQYRDTVKKIALDYGIKYIDVLDVTYNNAAAYLSNNDNIHPGYGGHQLYAGKVLAGLAIPVEKGTQTLANNGLSEFSKIKIDPQLTDTLLPGTALIGYNVGGGTPLIPMSSFLPAKDTNLIKGNFIVFGQQPALNGLPRFQVQGSGIGANYGRFGGAIDATGAGLFTAYTSAQGNIFAYDWTLGPKNLAISQFGGITMVGTSTASGNAPLQVAGNGYVSGSISTGINAAASNLQVARPTAGIGVVQVNIGSLTTVTTSTAQFLNTFRIGDQITLTTTSGSETRTISAIASNTSMTVSSAFVGTALNVAYTVAANPDIFHVRGNGRLGIGVADPSSFLHIRAGTATAGTAPLKFTTGPLLTTPEAGAFEMLNDTLYWTGNTGTRGKVYPQSGGGSGVTSITATSPLTGGTITTTGNIGLGTVPIANGGTNNASLSVTAGNLFYSDGSKLVGLAHGTTGQSLRWTGSAYAWVDTAAVAAADTLHPDSTDFLLDTTTTPRSLKLVNGHGLKVYKATLSQSGTNAPVPNEFVNSIGVITWSYVGSGSYEGACTGCFPANKVWFSYETEDDNGINDVRVLRGDDDTIRVLCVNGDFGLSNTSIEVNVKP